MEASRSSSDVIYYFGRSEETRKPYAISAQALNYLAQHYNIDKDFPFYMEDSILEHITNESHEQLLIFNFKDILYIKFKSEINDVDAFLKALCPE